MREEMKRLDRVKRFRINRISGWQLRLHLERRLARATLQSLLSDEAALPACFRAGVAPPPLRAVVCAQQYQPPSSVFLTCACLNHAPMFLFDALVCQFLLFFTFLESMKSLSTGF